MRKTWHVFRCADAMVDEIDKGTHEWRRIPHLPRDNNRNGRRRIALELLYNDTRWKQRAHRIGQERKSQPLLDETQVAEHVVSARYGVHANARLAVKRRDRIVQCR